MIYRKIGLIPAPSPLIAARLQLDQVHSIRITIGTERSCFRTFIGPVEAMRDLAERFSKTFLKGQI